MELQTQEVQPKSKEQPTKNALQTISSPQAMKSSQVSILCPVENSKPLCSAHNSKLPATTDRTVLRAYQTAI